MRSRGRLLRAAAVAVVLVLAVLVGLRWWGGSRGSDLSDAVDAVPKGTQRLAFTDWAAVRERLGIEADDDPSAADVEKLADRGYDLDLSAVSSIDESTAALQKAFGFSPMTMDWEAYAQAEEGATMVARMPGGFDFDTVRDRLEELGFTAPEKDDGVWLGGIDLVSAIDPTITPELQYVALIEDRHLIVTSDTESYAAQAAKVARGDGDALGDVDSARDLAGKAGEPAAAMLWPRDFACSDLAMSQADPDTQAQAEELVAAAGGVSPLSGMAMTLDADRTLSAIELFDSGAQAKDNLKARATLAVGEAAGRGGSFSDDLTLTTSRTDGAAVVLRWKPKQQDGFVLSALDSGPVLFATC